MGLGLSASECSAPVGVCQQRANKGCCSPPQRLRYSKLEVKSLNAVISDAGSLKLQIEKSAWVAAIANRGSLSEIVQSSLGF